MSFTHYYICFVTFYCLLQCVDFTTADPLVASTVNNIKDAQKYLRQFGYFPRFLNESAMDELPQEDQDKLNTMAIKMYQEFMGLNETGELDGDTIEMMQRPRCGRPDINSDEEKKNNDPEETDPDMDMGDYNGRRRRRFAFIGRRWSRTTLSYNIMRYSAKLSTSSQDSTMVAAFNQWARVSRLRFFRSRASADINIGFYRGAHGDGGPFDGPGGTLAHAYAPGSGIGGDAHFDEDEAWTRTNPRGRNLVWVATHEFGHSLGLGHSRVNGAVMFATYPSGLSGSASIRLHADDIAGIQALYGGGSGGGGGGGLPSGSRCSRSTQCASRRCVTRGWWWNRRAVCA